VTEAGPTRRWHSPRGGSAHDERRSERPVARADMLIAASALVRGIILVTRNVSDFEGCGIALLDPFD
jgi:predicted nucleic acid-binding protein